MKNDFDELYQKTSDKYNLDPRVLKKQGFVESSHNPAAIGPMTKYGRALGIGQFLEQTAKSLDIDPMNPEEAIDGQGRLMRENLNRYGNYDDALRAYHGGTNKDNWGPKTNAYVQKIMSGLDNVQLHNKSADELDSLFAAAEKSMGAKPAASNEHELDKLFEAASKQAVPQQVMPQPMAQQGNQQAVDVSMAPQQQGAMPPQNTPTGVIEYKKDNWLTNALDLANKGVVAAVETGLQIPVKIDKFAMSNWPELGETIQKRQDFIDASKARIEQYGGKAITPAERAAVSTGEFVGGTAPFLALGGAALGGAAQQLAAKEVLPAALAKVAGFVGRTAPAATAINPALIGGAAGSEYMKESGSPLYGQIIGGLVGGGAGSLVQAGAKGAYGAAQSAAEPIYNSLSKVLKGGGAPATGALENTLTTQARGAVDDLAGAVPKSNAQAVNPSMVDDVARPQVPTNRAAPMNNAAVMSTKAQDSLRNFGVDPEGLSNILKNQNSPNIKSAMAANPTAAELAKQTALKELQDIKTAVGGKIEKFGVDYSDNALSSITKESLGEGLSGFVGNLDRSHGNMVRQAYNQAKQQGANVQVDPIDIFDAVSKKITANSNITYDDLKPLEKRLTSILSKNEKNNMPNDLLALEDLRQSLGANISSDVSAAHQKQVVSQFKNALDDEIANALPEGSAFEAARSAHKARKGLQEQFDYFINPKTGEATTKDPAKFYSAIISGKEPDKTGKILDGVRSVIKSGDDELKAAGSDWLSNLQRVVMTDAHLKLQERPSELAKMLNENGTLKKTYRMIFDNGDGALSEAGQALQDAAMVSKQYLGLKAGAGSSAVNADVASMLNFKDRAMAISQSVANRDPINLVRQVAGTIGAGKKHLQHRDAIKYFIEGGDEPFKPSYAGAKTVGGAAKPFVTNAANKENNTHPPVGDK
jgi:regulator of replication initiation timing